MLTRAGVVKLNSMTRGSQISGWRPSNCTPNFGGEDADDGVVPGIEREVLAYRILAAEKARRQFVTDQRHLISAGLVFCGGKAAARQRLGAQNIEEVSGDAFGFDLLRAFGLGQIYGVMLIGGNA